MYAYMYVCMYVCMKVSMYVYVCVSEAAPIPITLWHFSTPLRFSICRLAFSQRIVLTAAKTNISAFLQPQDALLPTTSLSA